MAIAWVLAKGRDIVPLVGARKRDRLDEALGALGIELSPSDVERIERAAPLNTVAVTRYNAYLMSQLDSENARRSSRTA
jgi:pyridoxine 4-dehydrogenase